jgi:hypothetical protein
MSNWQEVSESYTRKGNANELHPKPMEQIAYLNICLCNKRRKNHDHNGE